MRGELRCHRFVIPAKAGMTDEESVSTTLN
jgi:hypothetical protein